MLPKQESRIEAGYICSPVYSFLYSLFPVIQSLEYYLLAQLSFLAVMVVLLSLVKKSVILYIRLSQKRISNKIRRNGLSVYPF